METQTRGWSLRNWLFGGSKPAEVPRARTPEQAADTGCIDTVSLVRSAEPSASTSNAPAVDPGTAKSAAPAVVAPAQKPLKKGVPVVGIVVEDAPREFGPKPKGSYARAVEDNGGQVKWLYDDGRPLDEQLEGVHALLLPGGKDVHPSLYGQEPDKRITLSLGSMAFDKYEIDVTRAALDRNMPIRGICRGHQILNVAAGGTLWQDIAACMRPIHSVTHRSSSHRIAIHPDSRLGKMLGDSPEVNSYHHQAVEELAPGFVPTAISADGTIEGMELAADARVMGVQFHPEKAPDSVRSRFFKQLVDDAKAVSKNDGEAIPLALTAEDAATTLAGKLESLQATTPRSLASTFSQPDPTVMPEDPTSGRIRAELLRKLGTDYAHRNVEKALLSCGRFTRPQADLIEKLLPALSGSSSWTMSELLPKLATMPDLSENQLAALNSLADLASRGESSAAQMSLEILKKPPMDAQMPLLAAIAPSLRGSFGADAYKLVLNASDLDASKSAVLESFVGQIGRQAYGAKQAIEAVVTHKGGLTEDQSRLLQGLAKGLGVPFDSEVLRALLEKKPETALQTGLVEKLLANFSGNACIGVRDAINAVLQQPGLTALQVSTIEPFIDHLEGSGGSSAGNIITQIVGCPKMTEKQAAELAPLVESMRGSDAWNARSVATKILSGSSH